MTKVSFIRYHCCGGRTSQAASHGNVLRVARPGELPAAFATAIVGKRTAWREQRGYCVGPEGGGVGRCRDRLRHTLRIATEVAGTETIRLRKWQLYYRDPQLYCAKSMAPTEEWSALRRGFASITLDVAVRPHPHPEGSIISGSISRCRWNVSGRTPVCCSQHGGNAGFVGEKAGGGVLPLTRPNLDDNAPAVYITELTQAFP